MPAASPGRAASARAAWRVGGREVAKPHLGLSERRKRVGALGHRQQAAHQHRPGLGILFADVVSDAERDQGERVVGSKLRGTQQVVGRGHGVASLQARHSLQVVILADTRPHAGERFERLHSGNRRACRERGLGLRLQNVLRGRRQFTGAAQRLEGARGVAAGGAHAREA